MNEQSHKKKQFKNTHPDNLDKDFVPINLAHKQKRNKEHQDQKSFDDTYGDNQEKNEQDLEKTPVYDESGKKL